MHNSCLDIYWVAAVFIMYSLIQKGMQENFFELKNTVKKEVKKNHETWSRMQNSWAVEVRETEKEEQGSRRRSNTVQTM